MEEEYFVNPLTNPGYIEPYWFEKLDFFKLQQWIDANWNLSIYFAAIYVALIYLGRNWMSKKAPYKVKGPLIFWNMLLTIFSIVGFVRTYPELHQFLFHTKNGLYKSVCSKDNMTQITLAWQFIFTISKVWELGDTGFIVLRKSPLIFLHWYHHTTVMIYTWFTYGSQDPVHRWFCTVNFGIHSFMYAYYMLRAMGVRLPKSLSVVLTSLQIIQMMMGIATNLFSIYAMNNGWACHRRKINILIALLMYASYFVLFANFFYQTYYKRSPSAQPKKTSGKKLK